MSQQFVAPRAFYLSQSLPAICVLTGATEDVACFGMKTEPPPGAPRRYPRPEVILPLSTQAAESWFNASEPIAPTVGALSILLGLLTLVALLLWFGGWWAALPAVLVTVVTFVITALSMLRRRRRVLAKFHFPRMVYLAESDDIRLEFGPQAAAIVAAFRAALDTWVESPEGQAAERKREQLMATAMARTDDRDAAEFPADWDQAKKSDRDA